MIRKAKMSDVKKIKKLLEIYAKKEILLNRSLFSIYESLRDFFVFEKNGKVVGCCAMHFWKDCLDCLDFPNCSEIAMQKKIK